MIFISREEYHDRLTFVVPQEDVKWSEIFGMLQKAKFQFAIDDYSVGQSSLEQIFLSFAQHQKFTEKYSAIPFDLKDTIQA
jgi:ATP-binding cassette, subfamily A (ABC1), member 3